MIMLLVDNCMPKWCKQPNIEFNLLLQSDACRLQQLRCHTAATGHPLNRFLWGNKKSLVDAMEKGINLREQMLKLYMHYYHGGLMKLVVIGGESLDVLQRWVVELFGAVKKGPRVNPEFKVKGPIWKSGKVYWLEAVKDVHMLYLTWTLPCLHQEYLKKPDHYIAYLLEHAGRGGLLSLLKARGWVVSLSAGVGGKGMYCSSMAYVFVMSIHLTNSGMEKMFDLIGFVYQYLKLLRQVSPQEWVFKELQSIGGIEFRFQGHYNLTQLAENMHLYPSKHVLYGDYVYQTWDELLIKQALGFFNPDNMRVDLVSKSFPKSEDYQYEPWFGSCYVEEDIAENLMELWRNPPEIDASLLLPSKNEFIPTDFSIGAGDEWVGGFVYSSSPRCMVDEPSMKLWYKPAGTFRRLQANTYLHIYVKGGYDNAKNFALSTLFTYLLRDELNEIMYQANVAKMETSISVAGGKLELKVNGFKDKLPVLLSKVLSVATSFMPTDNQFKVIKEYWKRTLENAIMNPRSHCSYLRRQVLIRSFYDIDEKLHYLNDLFLGDLKAFVAEFRSQLYVEGLCHGNLSEEEAISLSNIFKTNFPVNPLPIELRHVMRVTCLPSSANVVRDACVKNKLEKNSVVEVISVGLVFLVPVPSINNLFLVSFNKSSMFLALLWLFMQLYFQLEQDFGRESIKFRALIDLFHQIVKEPLFNQLRTKEQLGYVAECGQRIISRVWGFCFCIVSSEYDPLYLQGRIDNFINGLEKLMASVPVPFHLHVLSLTACS